MKLQGLLQLKGEAILIPLHTFVSFGLLCLLCSSDIAQAASCKDIYYNSLRNGWAAAALATSDGLPVLGKHSHGFACGVGRGTTLGVAKSEAIRYCLQALTQHQAKGQCQVIGSHM